MKRTYELNYEEHFLTISADGQYVPDSCKVRKVTDDPEELYMAVRIACEGPSVKYDPLTIQIYQEDANPFLKEEDEKDK